MICRLKIAPSAKIESLEQKLAGQLKERLVQDLQTLDSFAFIGKIVEGLGPESVRKLAGELRQELPDLLLVFCTITEGKPFVVIGLGDRLVDEKHLDATKIVREIVAPKIKGGGGGQKTLATAGGQDASSMDAVIASEKRFLRNELYSMSWFCTPSGVEH